MNEKKFTIMLYTIHNYKGTEIQMIKEKNNFIEN